MEIVVADSPLEADRLAVSRGLEAFNLVHLPADFAPLGVFARADGQTRGGLVGWTWARWLFVSMFWLPEAMRGQGIGGRVLAAAEARAAARGAVGVWLDTFSFQSRGFYERHGYALFGELGGHPPGHTRYFLHKRLGGDGRLVDADGIAAPGDARPGA